MIEEELIQIRQEKEELQAQIDSQKKLIEQQQEHIDLLEQQNRLREQQIETLMGEVKVQQEQPDQMSHLSPASKRSLFLAGSSRQKNRKKLGDQLDRTGQRLRFSSPRVIIGLVMLVLLLFGGSLGIYRVALGHLQGRRNPVPVGHITEFPLQPKSGPTEITTGPDGNLWFTEGGLNSSIGRVTPDGKITTFSFSTPQGTLGGIVGGSDGNPWFIDSSQIGRITPSGKITQIPLPVPTVGTNNYPWEITVGPDGNLWFTFYIYNGGSWLGRITPSGVIAEIPLLLSQGYPYGITKGPDGNLWFTIDGSGANQIGRITTSGALTVFPLPASGDNSASEIIAGPDGNLWFTDPNANKIGCITPTGVVTEFALPTANSYPSGMAKGSDGNLWFTELNGNKIGRITPRGKITEFSLPTAKSAPYGITAGPDGNLWFTESGSDKIGRITTGK